MHLPCRTNPRVLRAAVALAMAVAALGAASPAPVAGPPSLYTLEQARSGHTLYVQNCARCHSADLTGGSAPDLVGPTFTASSLTFGGLYQTITHQMPLDDPASLTATQYAAIVAYVLASNCYPAGTAPYPADGAVPNRTDHVSTQGGAGKACLVK